MPDVSVLLPCYNASATLEETLTSLQKQTYPDFEVICVNDGSTDRTSALLSDWAKKDPRFIYVPKRAQWGSRYRQPRSGFLPGGDHRANGRR